MPNPFSFEFTVRQHTPVIHFQADQKEATIRATEVKPKLDNVIFSMWLKQEKKKAENNQEAVLHKPDDPPSVAIQTYKDTYRQFLVSTGRTEHAALDYQLVIEVRPEHIRHYGIGQVKFSKKENKSVWDKAFPAFFANTGQDKQDKKGAEQQDRFFSYSAEPVRCKIKCLNPDLLDWFNFQERPNGPTRLQTLLTDFFLKHNFGMRQSKGFGSFTLDTFRGQPIALPADFGEFNFKIGSNHDAKPQDKKALYNAHGYTDTRSEGLHSNWFQLFDRIDLFYRTLRSGINLPGGSPFYFKSLMFHWAKNKDVPEQWDKKTIRFQLFGGGNGTPAHEEYNDVKKRMITRDDPDGTFHYLPPGEQPGSGRHIFRDLLGLASTQEWGSYKSTVTKEVKNEGQNDEIKRFKSPIQFKPIYTQGQWRVLIQLTPIPQTYFNATFTIKAKGRGDSIPLYTPEGFRLTQYLRWAIEFVNDANPADLVGKGQEKNERLNQILDIYKQLKPDDHE